MTASNKAIEIDLAGRLHFIGLDENSADSIRSLKPIVDRHLEAGLGKFYERLSATPAVRQMFQNSAHIERASRAQTTHWSSISGARFDDAYVATARRIGTTHAKIGLEPRWYIGGYALILEQLIKSIVLELWPKGLMNRGAMPSAEAAGTSLANLIKAALLDMDLAISVYIDAAEDARLKAEAAVKAQQEADAVREQRRLEAEREAQSRAAREQAAVVQQLGTALSKLAAKDLSYRLTSELPEGYQQLRSDFNQAISELGAAMRHVANNATGINSGTKEISTAADDLARQTERQAANLEQTVAALGEITGRVAETAKGVKEASKLVTTATDGADRSGIVVRDAVKAMSRIEESSRQISQIIGVIEEIAFQTNLLALNAGVEAARAGDAGRGFAVVASEVRALAQRAAAASKEIKVLIVAASNEVGVGSKLVVQAGQALADIATKVAEINKIVSQISSSAQVQSTGLTEVNSAVNEIGKLTQQNAAMAEQTTAATRMVADQADELNALVTQFKLGSELGNASVAYKSEPAPVKRLAQAEIRKATGTDNAFEYSDDAWEEV